MAGRLSLSLPALSSFVLLGTVCIFFRLRSFAGDRSPPTEFLPEKQGVEECDVFEGGWVWDESYPLYESRDCAFLDGGFRCLENGRKDTSYSKWRWQPKNCNLPRFNALKMLEMIRNKRLVFVGDSIGRNQWESLLCLLSQAIPRNAETGNISPPIYELKGRPVSKHSPSNAFRFRDYNCTVEYYRSPFLVAQGRPPRDAPKLVKTTLRLDTIDLTSWRWRGASILVFNAGHWWNTEKTTRSGCYFQEGDTVNMNMNVDTAYRKSIQTLIGWVSKEININKTKVFFRSYSPSHIWPGGECRKKRLPDTEITGPENWDRMPTVPGVGENIGDGGIRVLNVTFLSGYRKDGHPSIYYLRPGGGAPRRQDCSHWCLPGVPDTWNELLLHSMM